MSLPKLNFKNSLLVFLGIVAVSVSVANVIVSSRPVPQVLAATDPKEKEIEFWINVTKLHPTYRDAYIELSELYMEVGDNSSAKTSIEKAISIDPHSSRAKELARLLL